MSYGRTIFQLGYEVSPIILTDGIAAGIPGGMLPIIAITQSASFVSGLLQGNVDINPDNYFARFKAMAGSTLQSNQIGQYPFANQAVAANAIIAQPLNLSMEMICPAREVGGYVTKLATLSALKQALDNHSVAGGTYTVATPSFIYTGCILTMLRDITPAGGAQVQSHWQFDFVRPLLALAQAAQATNSLMSKISGGLTISGTPAWSSVATTVGSAYAGAVANVIPSANNLIGTLSGGSDSLFQTP